MKHNINKNKQIIKALNLNLTSVFNLCLNMLTQIKKTLTLKLNGQILYL